jgi:hypothetical protein
MTDTPDTKHAMTRLLTETWASFHIRQKLELEAIERERDELRERVRELESALEWIAETPDAWLERDAPDGATVYEWRYSRHFLDIAREALTKTKENKWQKKTNY